MNAFLLASALVVSNAVGQTMYESEMDTQNAAFQTLWETDFNWNFDELPASATVAEQRIPYSGYIYPNTHGGTISALRKYDEAFDLGGRAAAFERRDTSSTAPVTRRVTSTRPGLFGRRTVTRLQTVHVVPHWYGHCNGWTSAAIRHAEPQQAVERNGVVFTPSDIKALLAEIYIYNHNEMLASGGYINPGKLHAIIANWLGRGLHPIGMEADPGHEKWNYPIYGYTMNASNRTPGHVDVQLTVTYAMSSQTETDESPRTPREKHFNYHLNLDHDGKIVGGYYYRSSARIEMLWIPLLPKAGGEKGNERGNPHIDIDEVIAIWRQSVPSEVRSAWVHVDPTPQDRLADSLQLTHLRPAQPEPIALTSATAPPGDTSSVVTLVKPDIGEVDETAFAERTAAESSADDLSSP